MRKRIVFVSILPTTLATISTLSTWVGIAAALSTPQPKSELFALVSVAGYTIQAASKEVPTESGLPDASGTKNPSGTLVQSLPGWRVGWKLIAATPVTMNH